MDVHDIFHGGVGVHEITGLGVKHALGLAGAAAGVEDEQRIIAVHLFRFTFGFDIAGSHFFMPPGIAAFGDVDVNAKAFDDNRLLDSGAFLEGGIGVGFAVDVLAGAQ
jgi:hypothetical protein